MASVQREGQSADLFQEKIGGGPCQENRRLEVKEDWLGTDLRARTEEQNNLRERPRKTKEEGTYHGENGGEKSSHGGNDLLETLQLLGHEVSPAMGRVGKKWEPRNPVPGPFSAKIQKVNENSESKREFRK